MDIRDKVLSVFKKENPNHIDENIYEKDVNSVMLDISQLIKEKITQKYYNYPHSEEKVDLEMLTRMLDQYNTKLQNRKLGIENVIDILREEEYVKLKKFEQILDENLKKNKYGKNVSDDIIKKIYKDILVQINN
tara:strand:- start:719 stop:1120 length:402 start_codon:yes stop_codon:yes gene_type:complete